MFDQKTLNSETLAQYIDHTLLRPDASLDEIKRTCAEAVEYRLKTVCIESKWLKDVVPLLSGSKVLPITVVSFPKGDATTVQKVNETISAIEHGAKEIDMVLNRVLLTARKFSECLEDIRSVVVAAKVPVKVILETSELTREEKVMACVISKLAGAVFVKTSTGFSKSGATAEDIALMRSVVGAEMGVKASGGVRTFDDAKKMIEAGATRIGASASVAILKGLTTSGGGY